MGAMCRLAGLLLLVCAAFAGSQPALADSRYLIRADRWTPADERGFGAFITALGDSGCRTVDACLKGAANPFRASDPAGARFHADCADLPYFLRFYYAWKRGLPFSYVSAVSPRGRAREPPARGRPARAAPRQPHLVDGRLPGGGRAPHGRDPGRLPQPLRASRAPGRGALPGSWPRGGADGPLWCVDLVRPRGSLHARGASQILGLARPVGDAGPGGRPGRHGPGVSWIGCC